MPQIDLARDLAHGLDPATFAADMLGFRPDHWQRELLRSTDRQVILNITRQGRKITTAAVLGLHCASYDPGSLTLLVSPSQRQSRELFSKLIEYECAFVDSDTSAFSSEMIEACLVDDFEVFG